MTNKQLLSAFYPYVFCSVLYSCSATLNSYLVKIFLLQNSFNFSEIDTIEFYKLFGYILAPLILIIRNKLFASKQVLILSLGIYLLTIISSINVPTYSAMKFHNLVFAATNTVFAIVVLCKLLVDSNYTKKAAVSLFFGPWIIGYLCAELIISLFLTNNENTNFFTKIVLNTIPIIGVFISVLFNNKFVIRLYNLEPTIGLIVKNMELEALAAFMIFYILMVILNGYEVYALTEHLLILSVTNSKYYMIGAILAWIYLLPKLYRPLNLYRANIICLVALIIIFATMPLWGLNYLLSAILWVLIGILLYVFFISNIIILTEKFDSTNLYYAVVILCLSSAIGAYAGYVTINATEDTVGENSFLISICFVLLSLMVYYMLRFKKDRLSKWTKN